MTAFHFVLLRVCVNMCSFIDIMPSVFWYWDPSVVAALVEWEEGNLTYACKWRHIQNLLLSNKSRSLSYKSDFDTTELQ